MERPVSLGTGGLPPPPLPPLLLQHTHTPPVLSPGQHLEGTLLLVLVAFLWGSYAPTLRWASPRQLPPLMPCVRAPVERPLLAHFISLRCCHPLL